MFESSARKTVRPPRKKRNQPLLPTPAPTHTLRRPTGRNLVNPLHIPSDTHLLGQLGALRQKGLSLEIVDLEYARSGFRGGSLELGRVDLDEPERVEVGTEEVANGGLKTEDGLVGRCLRSRCVSSGSTSMRHVGFPLDPPNSPSGP